MLSSSKLSPGLPEYIKVQGSGLRLDIHIRVRTIILRGEILSFKDSFLQAPNLVLSLQVDLNRQRCNRRIGYPCGQNLLSPCPG